MESFLPSHFGILPPPVSESLIFGRERKEEGKQEASLRTKEIGEAPGDRNQ